MERKLLIIVLFLYVINSQAQKTSEVWSVYPNPLKEDLYIDVNVLFPSAYTITLHDVLGNVIFTVEKTNASYLHLSLKEFELNNGFYFLKLSSNKEVYIKKLMIKH
jgi:hypothetical protein